MDAFTNNKLSGFVRIVVVNPLHQDLHRLVLVWVRRQWEVNAKLWEEECEQVIGLYWGMHQMVTVVATN
jgi:hypothetical protein